MKFWQFYILFAFIQFALHTPRDAARLLGAVWVVSACIWCWIER